MAGATQGTVDKAAEMEGVGAVLREEFRRDNYRQNI